MSNVVIVGGGIGGLTTALKIKKKLPAGDRLILIDKTNPQFFAPSYLWLLIGERELGDISRGIPEGKLAFIHDEAVELLPEKKIIKTRENGSLNYDILVLASGGEYNEELFPGLKESGYNFHTPEGALGLREKLNTFSGGEIAILMPEMPVKCPPATYETAFLLNSLLKRKGLSGEYKITIYTPEIAPLIDISPTISEAVIKELIRQKIAVMTGCEFKKIGSRDGRLIFKNFTASFDLLIYIAPFQGSSLLKGSGLATTGGWIPVDPHYLYQREDIFALGDAAYITLPSGGYLFKAGLIATFQSSVVSKNILALLQGRLPAKTYNGFFACLLELGEGRVLAGAGNLYKKTGPTFHFIPESRAWRSGKRFVEYKWRHEGVKPLRPSSSSRL